MKLILAARQFSCGYLYINLDAIDCLYEDRDKDSQKLTKYVLLRSGIIYDINDTSYANILSQRKPTDEG